MVAMFPCLLAAQHTVNRIARVRVVAFDTRGALLDPPDISIFTSRETGDLASKFHGGVADGIPYGAYRIRAHRTAYSGEVRHVWVYQPQVTVVVGLTFGYELPVVPPTLPGRVIGAIVPGETFVKLVGVYSSGSTESAIDSGGAFELGGLSDGRFLLLVVSKSGVLASRPITIPYTGPPLEIEIATAARRSQHGQHHQ
jgi:hypothetical protein